MCGKKEDTANLQDLLVFILKGIGHLDREARMNGIKDPSVGDFVTRALFTTITNVNFDNESLFRWIREALKRREELKVRLFTVYRQQHGAEYSKSLPEAATWTSNDENVFHVKAAEVGYLSIPSDDVRSLRATLIIGLKGISAYLEHAAYLGYTDPDIYDFVNDALASTLEDLQVDAMVGWVLKCGEYAVKTMALLDKANTTTFGNPEITKVNIGVGKNPGILVSGHDLRDLRELLEQTEGTGIDIYTHSEMLPAHYYPELKKFKHLVGNYGGSWWHQDKEFATFNGPILMTTNCIVPVKDSYRDRIFTTGVVDYPGVKHLPAMPLGHKKDFSELIALAKTCPPPQELETGEIVGGFAHGQVLALADKVVEAVKSGAIKRFVVMAGCDGRQASRAYFTDVAETLPKDTIILTAGCAKYRYNKLSLGDIGGIPRVLDAGQCNDSYSLAVIALKLKEVFGLSSLNELPLSFDIAWYEQKAVAVLLALLSLGVKGIRLGPTLPAFLSPNVLKVLVDTFDLKLITDPQTDVTAMMAGQ
jgi:hydroxylamine reductase